MLSVNVSFAAGWNMISNPVTATNDSVRYLFPSALFPYAFRFDRTIGYFTSYTLENGRGYWGKFGAGDSANIMGIARYIDTLEVSRGWNVVGSISFPVDTGDVLTIPPGIRASPFFGYSGGYSPVDTIEPGNGYWVKMSDFGSLILAATAVVHRAARFANPLDEFSTITVADATGASQTLYIGVDDAGTFPVAMYELPPVGPEGAFDARFESQQMVEVYRRDSPALRAIQINPLAYPLEISWSVTSADNEFILSDGTSPARKISGTGETTISNSQVKRVVIGTQTLSRPRQFSLEQNYPNPFNPTTEIKFSVATTARATLEVFNLLGQKVAVLFDDVAECGRYYSVELNGGVLSSGVYYYRLQSGQKSDAKKLMLIK
jgi:hypothetical protein